MKPIPEGGKITISQDQLLLEVAALYGKPLPGFNPKNGIQTIELSIGTFTFHCDRQFRGGDYILIGHDEEGEREIRVDYQSLKVTYIGLKGEGANVIEYGQNGYVSDAQRIRHLEEVVASLASKLLELNAGIGNK